MPKSDEVFVALASDLFVASLLGTIFYRANCPILAGWYFSMIFWCIISHCLLSMRHWLQMQRLQDAQIEQKAWAHEVEEHRRWSQMQRERWGDRHH
jgi:hypothetical protein